LKLIADNLWARVEDASPEDLAWLRQYLTVPVKGAEHTDAYQNGVWDGSTRLLDERRQRFGAGLVRMVVGRAREAGVQIELQDVRREPRVTLNASAGAWLRSYQTPVLERILERRRGIVAMPTGSGKSELFAALAQAVPVRWLILVDTKDLMHQAADRIFLRTGERAGLWGDGEKDPRRVTVATLQALLRGIGDGGQVDELLEGAQGLVCDEVQVLAPGESHKVAMATPNAYWRIGLSATPLEREDEDDYRTIEALGPLIVDVPVKELVDAGVLARIEILMVQFQQHRMTGTWGEVYEAGVVLNADRNRIAARIAASPILCPRPALAFVKAVPHGRAFMGRLDAANVRAEYISGVNSTNARNGAKIRLNTGRSDVLVVSKIFNKGVDIPFVESAVNLAAGRSRIDAIQKPGRLMRIAGEKELVRYWDFLDVGNRWLEAHARLRMEAYRSRGYETRVVREDDLSAMERA